jgi:hypothetical protein
MGFHGFEDHEIPRFAFDDFTNIDLRTPFEAQTNSLLKVLNLQFYRNFYRQLCSRVRVIPVPVVLFPQCQQCCSIFMYTGRCERPPSS